MKKQSHHSLRSHKWFSGSGKNAVMHRSWMKNQGYPNDMFDGRPIVGICNTWSDLTPCNGHLRQLAEKVKYGVYEAGGFPVEFPVFSCGESNLRPTAMMFRNLASMDVEEAIRGNPIDGVVLLTGCDKTTPSLLMGSASVDIPAIVISGGPMLNGKWKGKTVGSGTAIWQFQEKLGRGEMSIGEVMDAEQNMARSHGSCNTMGTASTMACLVEALGMSLSGSATIPAVDSQRKVNAQLSGRRILQMIHEDLRPSKILKKHAFENAIVVNAAIGGSTNAVLHLLALARRVGVDLTLDDWDRLGRNVPTLVNLQPSGEFLMEELFYAGGIPVVMKKLAQLGLLKSDALNVENKSLWESVKEAENFDEKVILPERYAITKSGGIAVVRGNLAPNGAVLKPSAASPELMSHSGKAVVFDSIEDYRNRIDDPLLEVDANSILVLKNCGPVGYPGMAEVGNMTLPKKLLQQGIRDMVRISDARMSGTAYGTTVLHVSPEAAVGGPLALVENGDQITLNVTERILHLDVPDDVLAKRKEKWYPKQISTSGYSFLYQTHVTQADEGCDFDFLHGSRGSEVARDSH